MNSLIHITMAALLTLSLACSDDGDTTPAPDKGADQAVADKGPTGDKAVGEASVGDTGSDAVADGGPDFSPDTGTPDARVTENKYWTEMKFGIQSPLQRVAGANATTVFAVGKKGLIMKTDGTSWTTMTNPDTNKSTLSTLWILPTATYWYALGDGIILYYSGSKWYKGYSSSYSNYSYNDMWAAKDPTVWAVGDGGMIYRKTSSSPSSNFSYVYYSGLGGKEDFKGIWGTSDTNIWVVGHKGAIYHCTSSCTSSSGWKKTTSPTTWNLRAITGFASNDIWAAGYNGTLLQYDGTSWKTHQAPTKTYFNDIWGTSKTNLFLVGHPHFKQDESAWHFNGTKWTKISPPQISYINSIWGDSTGKTIYAVGNYNILKWKGAKL